ncbi:unnamed protein product [Leptidea sinapis]|uniref:Uncharacterized protein n=1 Tax=Leptidea sinapis TaxID=189913 RepID=A0A5E4Q969_9NEOP|nr:unnamed protein product [Leptidea sinapis]
MLQDSSFDHSSRSFTIRYFHDGLTKLSIFWIHAYDWKQLMFLDFQHSEFRFNLNTSSLRNDDCRGSLIIITIVENLSPYLYPFGIEFNILIVAVYYIIWIICFNQTRKLDINEHPISLLDDILLFVCLPAFFMETVLSMIAVIDYGNIIKSIDYMVMTRYVAAATAGSSEGESQPEKFSCSFSLQM